MRSCTKRVGRDGGGAGEKPEALYPEAAEELAMLGHASTVSYVAQAAAAVFRETGLLPHVNAGTLTAEELLLLRGVSASQVAWSPPHTPAHTHTSVLSGSVIVLLPRYFLDMYQQRSVADFD